MDYAKTFSLQSSANNTVLCSPYSIIKNKPPHSRLLTWSSPSSQQHSTSHSVTPCSQTHTYTHTHSFCLALSLNLTAAVSHDLPSNSLPLFLFFFPPHRQVNAVQWQTTPSCRLLIATRHTLWFVLITTDNGILYLLVLLLQATHTRFYVTLSSTLTQDFFPEQPNHPILPYPGTLGHTLLPNPSTKPTHSVPGHTLCSGSSPCTVKQFPYIP